jgi:tetratricopeptide (TPR) repeat protein
MGIVYEEISDFQGAEHCFREALRHDPRYANAHAELAQLLRGRLSEADLAAQRRLLTDSGLTGDHRAHLHFGLAAVLDARGIYADATEHLEQGNSLRLAERCKRGQGYDPESHARFVAGLIAAFTPLFFERVRSLGLRTETWHSPVG